MGLEATIKQNMQNSGLTGIDRLAYNAMFPQSQMDKTQYAVPTQLPTSAETIRSDYDSATDAYTGLPPRPFKAGGLAGIPRFNGEDGSEVQPWSPESGQVTLLQPSSEDPSAEPKTVGYTIPKDDIKSYVAYDETDATGNPLGGGQYILKDGSAISVNSKGIVSGAVPGKNDYTLNEQGYYQPTGANLNWYGDQNRLTKNIGGVEVDVPNIYHKGGYQDDKGNLRTDANGLVVPLAPAYLDSGAGKSGLADAAPYIALAAMTAATMGAGATGFAGMVPASETLMGGLGALGAGSSAVPLSQITGSTFAGPAFQLGAAETAAGAGALGGAAAGGGGAAGGAGGAAANTITGSQALNTVRGAMMANALLNQLSGGSRQSYSGQGVNPYGGNVGFNPGTRTPVGLPGMSAYERTPWANMMPQISLSKLSEFAPTKEMSGGGTAESDTEEQILRRIRNNIKGSSESNIPRMVDDLLESQRRAELLDKINARFDVPSAQYVEGLGLMTPPPSVSGRLGVNSDALGGNIRAGLSGNVMMTPDKKILANPGMMDIGYRSSKESEYDPTFDISLQRALKSMPGRSRDYAVAANYTVPFAQGGDVGHLGGYSDGGRLLKGPGDGMSDNIPASIANKQPARLADGEFVIPADVVSHLGNGSTDAGAKQLYAMMDKVRKARTGNKKQGKQINPSKFLPKG